MGVKGKYIIERKYISFGKSRSGQKIKKVLFVVEHETSNNTADADDHYRYFNKHPANASAHTFIDDKKILEIIPLNEKAWHVNYNVSVDNRMFGDDANDAAIGVELCRTGNFKKAYDKYVWYNAYLCHQFNLKPEKHLVQHSVLDPQRRSDPESWLKPNGVTWNQFIKDVRNYYDNWEVVPQVKGVSLTVSNKTPKKNPQGIGIAVSKYPDGYGVNTYKTPNGEYSGRINKKIPFIVHGEKDGFIGIGNEAWVPLEHMEFRRYTARSKYPEGYGVNYYDAPNGKYKGKITEPIPYPIYGRIDGWVDIGQSKWIPEEHLIIE